MITRCFTFGYGHVDPIDQSPLANCYARITAPTAEHCRSVMVALFGNKWAFECDEDIEQDWVAKGLGRPKQRYQVTWNMPAAAVAVPDEADDEEALAKANAYALLNDDERPDWIPFEGPRGVQTVQLPEEDQS